MELLWHPFSGMRRSGNRAMKEGLDEGLSYLEIRNRKVEAIRAEVKRKLAVFGCCHKA